MEDKDMREIIKNLIYDDKDILKIEEDIFFSDDLLELEEGTSKRIKDKTYSKLNLNQTNTIRNKRKFNRYIKIASIFMIGALIALAPVGISKIQKLYSYIPGTEEVIQDNDKIYVLNNKISKTFNKNEIVLESVVLDAKNNQIYTKIKGIGNKPLENATIEIGDMLLKSSNFLIGAGGNDWTVSHIFNGDFMYDKGKNLNYKLFFEDNNVLDFDIKLDKATEVKDYSELGSTDTKNRVSITAITKENGDILDVNFIGLVDGKNSNIVTYGKDIIKDEYDTGITLVDADGKIVNGKLIRHSDRANHFEFDIAKLKKPYVINVPSVNVNIYGAMKPSEKIKIDLPKNDKVELNKKVKLYGENENIVKENDILTIKNIFKSDENEYTMDIEFPKNKDNDFKLSNVAIESNPILGNKNLFKWKKDFIGWGSIISENDIIEKIIIQPETHIKNSIEFVIYPKDYIIDGNWSIKID